MTSNLIQQDQEQRARALTAHESFIVQAPAGSGKTELIIQRFLTLLSHVKKPEEILAITFTKKSAHEMRTRVLKALDEACYQTEPEKPHEKLTWQLASAVLKRDQQFKWNLIQNPNQLHIKTIDSFCTYLTGQLPLLSHFGSQPDITPYSETLYRDTVLEILSHVEEDHPWSSAVATLLSHTDNDLNRLAKLLINLLQKRDQWQRYLNFDKSDEDIRFLLGEQIAAVIDYSYQQAEKWFPNHLMEELLALTYFSTSETPSWKHFAELLLTKQYTWRKQVNEEIGFPTLKDLKGEELKINRAMRARHKALVEALNENEALRSSLETIKKLPEPHYTDTQWLALKALLEVLKITLAQLRVTFQANGQIDFIENALGAAQALGDETNPTDLALSLDYQIRHILVDEFQDTSFSQHRLLEMLTHGWQPNDGRSLFVVGDPMQSIYRFRQAEVGLFIRMQQQGIGDIRLIPLTLAVNFRSTPTIVDWNNQHFAEIFPAYSDIGTGAVHYSHSTANTAPSIENHSNITINGFKDADKNAQADAVITLIKDTLSQWPDEKIAILVRSRSHLAKIVPALKTSGLLYNAVEIDPLITRQCIQDLLALTRALIHPADRIGWLSILRAPWCGLLLSDLLLLCGNERYTIIWERMQNFAVLATLSQDGQARIARIIPILQSAIHNRNRSGFRQWIEQTWLALGGPATLNDETEMSDTEEYFNLLETLSAESPHINLATLNARITQLRASTNHDDAAIQIMTIHSAKGLEFDTVILPHLEKFNPADEKSLLLWMEHPLQDDDIALLLAPIHASDSDTDLLYRYIEDRQKVKAHFEVDRLLYVATTRAKKRLHLLFNLNDEDKGSSRGSFLYKLWPLIKNKAIIHHGNVNKTTEENNISRPISRFVSNWRNLNDSFPLPTLSAQQKRQGFELRDHTARLIGTTSHAIFQQLSLNGIKWWEDQTEQVQLDYIKRQLVTRGIAHDLDQTSTTIQQMMKKTLNDERGRWILAPHQEAASEFQLTTLLDDEYVNIIIDRTFIDENNTRWIIDYKTSVNQDDDMSIFLTKQKDKHLAQLQKYQQAFQSIDKRPVKIGLYFPAIPAWCEIN